MLSFCMDMHQFDINMHFEPIYVYYVKYIDPARGETEKRLNTVSQLETFVRYLTRNKMLFNSPVRVRTSLSLVTYNLKHLS
jgi:hypothetical protein